MRLSPARTALGLFFAAIVLFVVSASGQEDGYWQDGPGWLGAIGWFGFLICLLLILATGVYAMASRMRHGNRTLPH